MVKIKTEVSVSLLANVKNAYIMLHTQPFMFKKDTHTRKTLQTVSMHVHVNKHSRKLYDTCNKTRNIVKHTQSLFLSFKDERSSPLP